jgi:hypothetical protein
MAKNLSVAFSLSLARRTALATPKAFMVAAINVSDFQHSDFGFARSSVVRATCVLKPRQNGVLPQKAKFVGNLNNYRNVQNVETKNYNL